MARPNSMLAVENASFSHGKDIFKDVSFSLDTARTALVGDNGIGKSTLLKCLAGDLELTSGRLVKSKGLRAYYLPQNIPANIRKKTVSDCCRAALERANRTSEDWLIDVVLGKLDLPPDAWNRPMEELSGGWQRLILIGAATEIEEPDILLLDEPTNYLDLKHINQLEKWLMEQPGLPMVIVSHDREFLERVTTRTLFLREDGTHAFNAPFSVAREELAKQDIQRAQSHRLEEKEIARLQAMANRYNLWGRRNPDFHKRQKATETRIERIQQNRTVVNVKKMRSLDLHAGELQAPIALRIEDLTVMTPDRSKPLYRIDKFLLRTGEKAVILGANGAGKTQLLENLHRAYQNQDPNIRFNPSITLAYFDQLIHNLPQEKSIFDLMKCVEPHQPALSETAIYAMLAKAGFSYERTKQKISSLSSGERARLYFLKMKTQAPNFYLLDEPTNHLDIEGQESLETSMDQKGITCLFVSHDRFFTKMVAGRFFEIQGGKLIEVDSADNFFETQAHTSPSRDTQKKNIRQRPPEVIPR